MTASAAAAAAPNPAVNKWIVAGTVLTGTVMAVLDSSIVNVALPDIRGGLGATVEQITWVVTGYILANVIIMPLIGMLCARYGRKNFYLLSVILFTLASMACGLARSLPLLVIFRIVQGIGGGVLMTVSQAILRETFPPEEQGVAMGVFGMGVVLAPALGPTLGGWLTDQWSWPWIFYINVPVGVLCVFLVGRYLHDPDYLVRDKGSIDFLGVGLLMVGLGSLQFMLEQGQRHDWFDSMFIIGLTALSIAGLLLFVWRELATARPAVDLRVLRNGSFTSATVLGGVLGMGLMGSLFLLPLFLQSMLGYTAMKSGIALMPRSLAMAVIMPIGGRFYNRLGPRVLVGAGLIVSAFSFWQLSHLTTVIGFWDIFWPQVWQGVGFSLIFLALSTAALATIDRAEMTAASGLYNVVRQIFGSIGIALSATLLTSGTAVNHARLAEHVTMFDAAARQFLGGVTNAMIARGVDAQTAARQALKLLDLRILREASVLAYNHIFLLITVLFALGLPLIFLLKAPTGPVEHEVMVE